MCFLADHGKVIWKAGLNIMGSETDGQGEPVKLAHLLGKDSYNVLFENTVNPDLQKSFMLLQSSSLLVASNGKVKECILVPRNAFIDALTLTILDFHMELTNGSGEENQKLLEDSDCWEK
jgi:hypothetical protein